MATDCIPQVAFKFYEKLKPVVARFDQAQASTDGGVVLLTALDQHLKLTDQLAACLSDRRDPDKIRHSVRDLLRERVFGLACGYEDGNDAARLADDPLHKLAVGRDPLTGAALASQPTLSRFENAVGPWGLARMGRTLATTVIAHHRRRLKGRAQRITIDLDPTDDPTHGQQEFTFFNGHYDAWCYLPLVVTLTFNDEPAQYLVAIVLCPGNSPAKRGAFGLLRALLRRLRRAFPGAALRVRVDGGFAGNDWLDFLETQRVEYVVGLASNARLERRAGRLLGEAYGLAQLSGRTEHVYGATLYAARSWSHRRRVIIKAEVIRLPGRDPKCNPRFVVTNLPDTPATVYQLYRQRGDVENRLKELHDGLALDRTSCSRFWANQFRVLLTAAAYVLLQELRRRAQGTACATAQVSTLRERLLKLAVWVERSVRRLVLHLPRFAPWGATWRRVARAVGAVPSSRQSRRSGNGSAHAARREGCPCKSSRGASMEREEGSTEGERNPAEAWALPLTGLDTPKRLFQRLCCAHRE